MKLVLITYSFLKACYTSGHFIKNDHECKSLFSVDFKLPSDDLGCWARDRKKLFQKES